MDKTTKRAGLGLPPMWETGRVIKGYTLLEILAVITLIGLMAAIAFPSFTLREERTQVKYIGNLVESDFRSACEEAMCTQSEVTVIFSKQGYQFRLGGKTFVRDFKTYKFSFKLRELEEEDSDSLTPDLAESGVLPNSEPKVAIPTLQIFNDGSVSGLTLHWETSHFSGTLAVDQDGVLKWDYTQKQ